MTIIGIDPGSTHSGICLIETGDHNKPNIILADKIANETLYYYLRYERAKDSVVAIEDFISYGIGGKSSSATSENIGQIIMVAAYERFTLVKYTRREYGQWITAGGKLSDATLRAGLESIYGPSAKKGDALYALRGATDKRSAFAVAKYHEFMASRVAVAGGA